ncbi:MAG: hypothetical protein V7711_13680 [Pseudomonadales bacterium]
MTEISLEVALPLIAWSRLWNFEIPEADAEDAWQQLDLPHQYGEYASEIFSTFALVGTDIAIATNQNAEQVNTHLAASCEQLDLDWTVVPLPAQQLSAICEITAYAIEREENVLARDLVKTHLLPWCEVAERLLSREESALVFMVDDFAQDLVNVVDHLPSET